MNNQEAIEKYIKSLDFMRIGQAINKGQWQSAAMIAQRLSRQAKDLELTGFERNLTGLRQSINRKNIIDAKQNLSMIINKRVQMLNSLTARKTNNTERTIGDENKEIPE